MRINEKATNMKITVGIKDYLYKKLAHLDKFITVPADSVLCEVELGKINKHHKNGEIFRTEINLAIAGKNFRAVSEMNDLFASIDVAKDEMVRELQKSKDKKVSAVRRGGAKAKSNVEKNY
ncbi:MAG: ribosome-associated translation inhibitor RaiA [Candidatus Paceibacterota bacterium]